MGVRRRCSPTTAWSSRPCTSGAAAGATHVEYELRERNITQKNSRPHHPTPCGKVEKLQQRVAVEYTTTRPHRSLPRSATPATTYTAGPKAHALSRRTGDTHDRVRTDKVGYNGTVTLRVAGRLRHIGIGRTHAGTDILLLVQDLEVRIVNAATGELLRESTPPATTKAPADPRPPPPKKQ